MVAKPNMSLDYVRELAAQMQLGLSYLHKYLFSFVDLTPESIAIDNKGFLTFTGDFIDSSILKNHSAHALKY